MISEILVEDDQIKQASQNINKALQKVKPIKKKKHLKLHLDLLKLKA
jgi:hypothetical protein